MTEQHHIGQGWHLRKEVSLSHLLTTLLVIAAVMKFGYDMDKRITVLEANALNRHATITKIEQTILRMDTKIDRLIERE